MPINRVHDAKVKLYWHQLLQEQDDGTGTAAVGDGSKPLLKPKSVPPFIPGLLLFPVPKAGPIVGYVDIAFWAETSYVVGSILYMVDSFYLWHTFKLETHDDATTPGAIINTAATAVFILNGVWCFVDWWLQYKQLSFLSLDIKEEYDNDSKQPVYLPKFSSTASVYYGCNNFFFLASAVIFLIQAIWWENETADLLGCFDTSCGSFWINFWGTFLQLLSGVFAVLEYFDYCKKRRRRGLKPLKLCTLEFERFDWFGWGDILYLLASLVGFYEVFAEVYINPDDENLFNAIYMASNFIFLIDSIVYLAGHIFYILELRNALKTGFLTEEQLAIINTVLQENLIEEDPTDSKDSSSSYIDESKTLPMRRIDIVNSSMTLADAKIAYREYLFERRTVSTSAITPFISQRLSSLASSGYSIASRSESILDFDEDPNYRKSRSFAEGTLSQKQDFSSTLSELIGSYTGSHGSYKSNMDSYMERVGGSVGSRTGSLGSSGGSLASNTPRVRGNSIHTGSGISGSRGRGNSVNGASNINTDSSTGGSTISNSNSNGVYSASAGNLSEQMKNSHLRTNRPFADTMVKGSRDDTVESESIIDDKNEAVDAQDSDPLL